MNRIQRVVLLSTAAVLILMLLFPPFYSGTAKVHKGYRFILNPIKMAYWDKEAEMEADKSFKEGVMTASQWESLSAEDKKSIRDFYFDEQKKKYPKKLESVPPSVNTFQLLVQVIIVMLAGGILWFAFKDEKKSEGELNHVVSNETSKLGPSESIPGEHENDSAKLGDRSTTGTSLQLWQAILGEKNRAYYESKFDQFDRKLANYQISWNWPAFFFGGIWALYRKMYWWFFIACIVNIFFISFYKAVSKGDWFQLVTVFFFSECVNIAFAIFANSLYQKNLRKKITKAKAAINDEDRLLEHLRHIGGVHTWVIWVCIALPIIGILLAIIIPTLLRR
jgi:hypothetical protein